MRPIPAPLTALLTAASLSLAALIQPVAAQSAAQETTSTIYLGTGGVTGVYFPAGGALCRLINRDRAVHGVRCVLESTGGSRPNLAALKEGEFDFVMVASDWHQRAVEGIGPFAGDEQMEDLRSVLSLHAEPLTIIVPADSPIQSFRALAGKRVNVGSPGTGRRVTMEAALAAFDMSVEDLAEAATLAGNAVADALCEGRIDAAVEAIGHPAQVIKDMADTCAVRFVPLSGPEITALSEERPYYTPAEIPAGTYRGQAEAVPSFGVRATLVTVEVMPEQVVYVVAKAALAQVETLRRLHPALGSLDARTMTTAGLSAPLHPGAERAVSELPAPQAGEPAADAQTVQAADVEATELETTELETTDLETTAQ